jgi:hypothetical protein
MIYSRCSKDLNCDSKDPEGSFYKISMTLQTKSISNRHAKIEPRTKNRWFWAREGKIVAHTSHTYMMDLTVGGMWVWLGTFQTPHEATHDYNAHAWRLGWGAG